MSATSFQTPTDQYVVTKLLRSAATASTYEVRRESDGESFILKQLAIGNMKDWKQFDLFEREVAALKTIEHPNVPRWVDSHLDEENGIFISVQTMVHGITLKQLLEDKGGFTAPQTESYLRQALEILIHLHERAPKIIHRDINPSNVMVADDKLFLIDFGAVKLGGDASTAMTTVGTFGYMAPEQILGRADVQSDLYGLGMTFVTMATGCEPPSLPQNPSTGQIDPSSVLRAPPALTTTLLALIRPGVAERPPSARAALSLLDGATQAPVAPRDYPLYPASGLAPVVHRDMSPYAAPEALTQSDKDYLKQHTLKKFSPGMAVTLHFLTWGIFSVIHYGMQHDRLPVAARNDPSAAKAIGFNFIPYFNLYWAIFNPLRLADRLNLQDRIRDRPDGISRGLILACGIMGMVPYLNFLLGVPLWGFGVYQFQKSINRLAEESEQERNDKQLGSGTPQLPPGEG